MSSNLPRTVLLIEDDRLLRESLVVALLAAAYEVVAVPSSAEGTRLAQELKPSLVLCDVHLADGDGRELLVALRQNERMATSQFVLMTGDRDGVPQRVSMSLGADDYLAKPFTVDEFLACVSARFRRAEMFREAETRATGWLRETVTRTLPHEFMTPLSAILGVSVVLRDELDEASNQVARDMVARIQASGERLFRTLKNYLTILELIDHPSTGAEEGHHLAGPAAMAVVRSAAPAAARRHGREADLVIVEGELSAASLPIATHNLSSVVGELVDNACKFSSAGSAVEISLAAMAGAVVLTITDTGRGMTNEQLSQIGAFHQFDRTRYEQQGLGLGLTLTQHLIERERGRFHIESVPGKGTTVFASWPEANA